MNSESEDSSRELVIINKKESKALFFIQHVCFKGTKFRIKVLQNRQVL